MTEKTILICAIRNFKDFKEGIYRHVGDRFDVSVDRYFEIVEKGGDWVVPVADISDLKKDESIGAGIETEEGAEIDDDTIEVEKTKSTRRARNSKKDVVEG